MTITRPRGILGIVGLAVLCAIGGAVPAAAQTVASSRATNTTHTIGEADSALSVGTSSATTASPAVMLPPSWSYGLWATAGVNQLLHTRVGHLSTRSLYIAGVRFERPLLIRHWMTLRYTTDVVPVAVTTQMPDYTYVYVMQSRGRAPKQLVIPSYHTARGVGFVPLGFQAELGSFSYLRLMTGLSGGGFYFDRQIPDPQGTHFNFTADGTLGLKLRTPIGAFTVGGRYHHLSNGGFGKVNPGMNSRMTYLGYDR